MALLGGDEDDIAATEKQEHTLNWLRAKAEEVRG
jgi:hypothetical protein